MKDKVRALIIKLENENKDTGKILEDRETPSYTYTALVHSYNNTLDIIKQMKEILLSV